MKQTIVVFALLLFTISISGQGIDGKWNGKLVTPGGELRVDFNITATEDGYTSTLDSPDQNAYGIPVNSTVFEKPELTIKVTDLDIVYVGKLIEENTIEGTFTQMGQSFEMKLVKKPREDQ